MTPSVKNVSASVHARLLNRSRETGEDFQFLLHRYAGERFLYRLGKSTHRQQYVLKGAMLFALWGGSAYRPTRDLDFTGYGENAASGLVTIFREICAVAVEDDGLIFNTETLAAEPIRDDTEYQGLRLTFKAALGNARIDMQVDVGFGNAIEPPAQEVEYPVLLDAPAPHIRAYPHEAVVAEKLHALVILGERTSRMKDFYDLHALSIQFSFDGATLAQAITATFKRRRTTIEGSPVALTPRFYADENRAGLWRGYLKRNNLPGAPADFGLIGERIMNFLNPIWQALREKIEFNEEWETGGSWKKMEDKSKRVKKKNNPDKRDFKAYPSYKPVDLELVGQVPAHWKVRRLKYLAELNSETLNENTDPDLEMVYVDIGNVDNLGCILNREALTFASAPSRARRIVKNGDVIVSTVRTYLRAIAPIKEPEPNLIVSTGFAVVRPGKEISPDFSAFALRAPYFVERVVAYSKGVSYPAITETEMATFELAIPNADEQNAITNFLHKETKKIDALVAKNERLIEKLQEKRAALISQAVTKGLDPTAPMKDSGIAWLGNFPSNWVLAPVYLRYEVALGKMLDSKRITGQFSGPYLRNIDVQWDVVNVEGLPEMDFGPSERERYRLHHGDLLVCEGGEVGRTAVWQGQLEECYYQKAIHRVRPLSRTENPRFFFYLMNSLSTNGVFVSEGNPNTINHLTADQLKHFRFPFPPVQEQKDIASFLDKETEKIDALVFKVCDVIARLKERRIALISAAVTGKIDVREEVA